MPPVVTEYDDALDDAAQEWIRVRIWTEGGQVVRFMVQYETTLAGQRVAVVRYDTAHSYAHRDQVFRHRRPVKVEFDPTLSFASVVAIAERDIRQHWRQYRREYEDQP